MLGRCKKCDALEKENAYLKSMIDRFLQKFQMMPIETVSPIGLKAAEEIEQEEPRPGVTTFGAD
jgi:hypothetical protein